MSQKVPSSFRTDILRFAGIIIYMFCCAKIGPVKNWTEIFRPYGEHAFQGRTNFAWQSVLGPFFS